jgi:hypothetical protein
MTAIYPTHGGVREPHDNRAIEHYLCGSVCLNRSELEPVSFVPDARPSEVEDVRLFR